MNKLMKVILGIVNVLIMIMAIMFAVSHVNGGLYVIPAVLACPVWYYIITKKSEKKHPAIVRLIQVGIIIVSFLITFFIFMKNPFYACHDFSVKQEIEEIYGKNNSSVKIEDITDISKQECVDYLIIKAKVITQKNGKKDSKTSSIYFDQIDGKFYASFDEMYTARNKIRKEKLPYKMYMFEPYRLIEIQEKAVGSFFDLHFDDIKKMCSTEFKDEITPEKVEKWTETLKKLGDYEKCTDLTFDYVDTQSGLRQQAKTIATFELSKGKAKLILTIQEDYKLVGVELY